MADLIVLVHAPVLGPASWRSVGDELSRAGHQVAVPALTGFAAGGPPYAPRLIAEFAAQVAAFAAGEPPYATRLIAQFADQVADQVAASAAAQDAEAPGSDSGPGQVILVVHSGAGPFAGQFAGAVPAGRVSVIFADAGLPSPAGPTPVVDAGFLPYLRRIARDGIVPPWPDWFPEAEPADLFPTEAARAAVLADARPLPLSFFEETLPAAPGTPFSTAGYLLFSEGYQQQAGQARERGWPVTELPGPHLHPLARPAEVATAITALAAQLMAGPRR